ncbi:MAG: hypothetical protein PQ964_08200 [Methanobacteriaceae archaeon]
MEIQASYRQKNLTVISAPNQTAATSESKNLTVISNPNVQLNQTANNTYTAITNVLEVNQTAEHANSSAQNLTSEEQAISTDTNSTNAQVDSSTTLTKNEMQNIIGMHWRGRIGTWGLAHRRVRFAIRHRRAIKAFGRDVITGGISAGAGVLQLGLHSASGLLPLLKVQVSQFRLLQGL